MKRLASPASLLCLASLLLFAAPVDAAVTVSKAFGSHMVLQQNAPIRVWGTADAGEQVVVELGGHAATGKAGADGKWRIDLPAMKADGKPLTMTIKGTNTITLKDVLLGEVWICSGQSNMEWSVQASLNPKEEIAAANHPMIRLYNVPGHVQNATPLDDPRGSWQVCSPGSVRGFSAVGYYFGRALQKELGVPIGLVGTNWGGTRIEPWTPPVGFEQVPSLHKDYLPGIKSLDPKSPEGKATREKHIAGVEAWAKQARANLANGNAIGNPPTHKNNVRGGATLIYNGMVHGLKPLSVRGAIWYQGESNAGDGLRYEHLKEALVKGWRTVFENDELSFYWVQLANFQQPNANPAGGGWGPVREGQRRALKLPRTGMAVINDIGNARDIHPKNKQDVGQRLALWALAKDYGKSITHSGPLYKSHKIEADKIRIAFDHLGGGLITAKKEGLAPTQPTPGAALAEFAIQDKAGKWHWAKAKIDGDTVLVWSEGVKEPKNVRYAYQSNPVKANLYNKEGLPASPFTTVD